MDNKTKKGLRLFTRQLILKLNTGDPVKHLFEEKIICGIVIGYKYIPAIKSFILGIDPRQSGQKTGWIYWAMENKDYVEVDRKNYNPHIIKKTSFGPTPSGGIEDVKNYGR